MASKREDVILALGLDPGTFSQDLAQAVAQMKGFSGAVATGHQTSAGAAGVDDKAHTGLLGTFKEFRKEQVQQGRMARFYAGELMGIVPAGDAVKGKLQELLGIGIEAAAGGFGFGLALEAAKFAIGGIVEIIQHAKKEEEELLNATSAMINRIGDETAKLRNRRLGIQPDDETRGQIEGAKNLLRKRHEDNIASVNAETEAERQAATERLQITNQQIHDWEKAHGKLEDFVRVNQAKLGEEQLDRAKKTGPALLALQHEYAAEEVKIRDAAERQKLEAVQTFGAQTQAYQDAVAAIERNRDEAIRRHKEEIANKHAVFMSAQSLLGATEEEKLAVEVANQKREMETQLAQARRANDTAAVSRIKEELAAYTAASDIRLRALRSQIDAQVQHNMQLAVERGDLESIKRLEEERAMTRTLGHVGLVGGDFDAAKRVEALRQQYDEQKRALERAAVDNPELKPQIDLAQANLKRKHDQDLLGAGGLSDLYSGTQDYAQQQLDQMQRMYAQIDTWRGDDVTKEAAAQQMKAELDARISQKKLQGAQQFFGTLASMQNSNIKELAAIGKAAAIAQATIDTYVGMDKALAQGGFFGFAMAAAVGAAGFANIASIASTFEVGGWTGGIAGRPAGLVHGEEFVVRAGPAARNRRLLEAMNAGASLSSAAVPVAAPRVVFENHGTSKVIEQQITPEEIRLIARDEVHREAPRAVAADLQHANSRVSRALSTNTKTERRR